MRLEVVDTRILLHAPDLENAETGHGVSERRFAAQDRCSIGPGGFQGTAWRAVRLAHRWGTMPGPPGGGDGHREGGTATGKGRVLRRVLGWSTGVEQ